MHRTARFVALLALVAGLALAVPGAPAGAAVGTPAFGTRTVSSPLAGNAATGGFAQDPSRCPAGAVVTGLNAVRATDPGTGWLTGVGVTCRAVVTGATTALGPAQAATPLAGFRPNTDTVAGDCPDGSVVTGFQGHAGQLVDSVQALCSPLQGDGTLGVATPGPSVGGPGGFAQGPFACPAGSIATGAVGRAGQDLNTVALECQSLTYQQPIPANSSWPTARTLTTNDALDDTLSSAGGQLWYRVPVTPGSRVQVDLGNLPADYDLAVFKDIGQAFDSLTTTADLTRLSAEFAGDAFSPSVFTPSVFTPSVFTPSVFTPSVFTPSVFTPSVFTPSVFTPSVFTPSVFTPSVFTPSVFTPANYNPSVFTPSVFTPNSLPPGFTADTISDAFASAQTRSLLAVSAADGTAPESTSTATWNNTGYFYIRVSGRNGAFSDRPFHLTVATSGGPCSGITLDPHADDATIRGAAGPQAVILTDPARLQGTTADKQALTTRLASLATATGGVVVDLANSPKVQALDRQADGPAVSCPYAKNLVAQAIRDIVTSYRGNLKYVVLVGGDHVLPFFRYPDAAGLGPESNFVPPVSDSSASQAALRGNYVLGQDAYGARTDVSIKGSTLPVPDLAVGRLVETAAEISANVARYLAAGAAPIRPSTSLVTGYDFLTDGADRVAADFRAAVPTNDALVTDADVAPAVTTVDGRPDRRHSWTATDLANTLLRSRHEITFLAGHFSANSALAADYATSLLTTQLASAPAGTFAGTLVFSAGCHSGYNIVDGDGVAGVTVGLDWAQAFAQQGATLVAGTGYQYGDTDFVGYGEQLYANLAHDLRYGSDAVSVGSALVQAKADYLAGLVTVTGIDQKTLIESTLFGLPMQGVDLRSGRLTQTPDHTLISPQPVTTDPGRTLGLRTAALELAPQLTPQSQQLASSAGGTVTANYLTGPDGVVANPGEPTVPLVSADVTDEARHQVLRGVGFRSGTYTDTDGITPLVGVATTEQSGAHTPFTSPAFFPNRIATPNYYGTLAPAGDGTTRLSVTPVQHRSDGTGHGTDTQRAYSALGFELFYSDNIATYGANRPALAAAPSITGVTSSVLGGDVLVEARVVGDPSAGIQQVWVTYTGEQPSRRHGQWASVDLTQDPDDSTLWSGTIVGAAGDDPRDLRFLVQGVNGVGLVGVDDNQGDYYAPTVTPSVPTAQQAPTTLVLGDVPAAVGYGSTPTVRATLTSNGTPVAGRSVTFALGGSGSTATTDADGVASAPLPATAQPGDYPLTAGFGGDSEFAAPGAAVGVPVTVRKATTALTIAPGTTPADASSVTLSSAGVPLREKTVVFVVRKAVGGALFAVRTAITDGQGVATLGAGALPSGRYTVAALFGTAATPLPSGTTDLSDPVYAPASSVPVNVTTMVGLLAPTVIGRAYSSAAPVSRTATASATGLPAGLSLKRAGNGSWVITGTAPRTAGWYTVAITSQDGGQPATTAYYLLVVGYATTPFAAPVNDPAGSTPSVFPASSTVPLRIRLTDAAGTPIPADEAAAIAREGRASVSVIQVASTSAPANEAGVAPITQAGTNFTYDAARNQLVYYANASRFHWTAGRTYLLSIVVRTEPGHVVAVRPVPVGFAKG